MSCGCGSSGSEANADADIYHGLLIPTSGPVREITLKIDDIGTLLNAETTDHVSKDVGDKYLIMFADGVGHLKGLPENTIASEFAEEKIVGPAILIEDEKKPLLLSELDTYLGR